MSHPVYRSADIDGLELFYREAGDRSKPTLLLLHGFPSAGHMFRDLIPLLADRYHLVAPDLPGFGRSHAPPPDGTALSFDFLAKAIGRFVDAIGLDRFALYLFDYGAPVGFRLATSMPARVTAIISQNGNAYEEGLSEGWDPVRRYWREPTEANRQALRALLTTEAIRNQYEHGVPDTAMISPDGWTLDTFYIRRAGVEEIMLDLLLDYRSNVALYPDFQRYFREHRPRLLAIWGRNDPFFLPEGADAYRRDLPDADIRFLDTGHFALETHAAAIAAAAAGFLDDGSR